MLDNEAAYRKEIEAQPDDDGLRLRFADWLEKRGDTRADAIRARCQQIQRIKEKLARLGYRLRPPQTAAAIRAFESKHGVTLPEDYVDFLVRVGDGGAGPDGRLFPIQDYIDAGKPYFRIREFYEFYECMGPVPEVVPLREGSEPPTADEPDNCDLEDGFIELSNVRAHYSQGLVVTGKNRGKVWLVMLQEPGIMVTGQTFLDWYERWLDGELDRLAKHEASLQERLAEESNSLPSGLELAGLYLRQARLSELDRLLERLDGQANAAASPEARIKVLALRARVHLARQEYPAAKELLRTGLAQFPDSVYLWQVQSHALLQEDKDPHAAEQALRKLIELQPDNAGARRSLQTLLSRQSASPNVLLQLKWD